MEQSQRLEDIREEFGIDQHALAAFVGLSAESYRDLESGADDLSDLTVIQATRLAGALGINRISDVLSIDETLPFALNEGPSQDKAVSTAFDNSKWNLAQALRNKLPSDLREIENDLGWDGDAIGRFLTNNFTFGDTPISALVDICKYLNISYVDILIDYATLVSGRRGHIRSQIGTEETN